MSGLPKQASMVHVRYVIKISLNLPNIVPSHALKCYMLGRPIIMLPPLSCALMLTFTTIIINTHKLNNIETL